ncbi:acyl CoA:acetate/3-ketoacid CoA transferase alpha subunit [Streptomyces luteogriseus]|nr:acyl CoA:acetate/3-ketoacid CoA transferase alpha subunit [Streptomyces luteogriseus]
MYVSAAQSRSPRSAQASASSARPADSSPWRYGPDGSVSVASPPKETREFRGRTYLLEEAVTTDFSLVRAARGDRHGNLVFHRSAANFSPLAAMAGRITIAEVEELVEPGTIDPDAVHLPGIYVDRVVGPVPADDKGIEKPTVRTREERH